MDSMDSPSAPTSARRIRSFSAEYSSTSISARCVTSNPEQGLRVYVANEPQPESSTAVASRAIHLCTTRVCRRFHGEIVKNRLSFATVMGPMRLVDAAPFRTEKSG